MVDKHETFEAFSDFSKMALLTAGELGDFNTMTIGWGMVGTMWSRPACTVYVRISRYTLEFLNRFDHFTVSFFDDHKKDLAYLGSHSGRDEDKVAKTTLTPVAVPGGVTFEEATKTLVCKKLYTQLMDEKAIPQEVIDRHYSKADEGNYHYMFIGEVTDVLA